MTKPKTPWRCQKCGGLGKIIPRAAPRSKICAWCADELRKAGQRWCTTGRHGSASWASKRAAMCRTCQQAYNQAYYADPAHREKAIAKSRAYCQAHHAETITANRTYYQAHRDELLAKKRVYYQERCELLKQKARSYRLRIPAWSREKMRARQRAKHQAYALSAKLNQRRRWLESLRPAASPHPVMAHCQAAATARSGDGGPQ